MPQIQDSILHDVKQMIGQDWEDTTFDLDITTHINAIWLDLEQLGVGPVAGYSISGADNKWSELIPPSNLLNAVKTYMYIRVRLVFDPPQTGPLVQALEKQVERLEFRINVEAERPVVVVPDVVQGEFPTFYVGDNNG